MVENAVAYVTMNKVVSALAALLLIIAGWLFSLLATSQQEMRDRQARYGERIAVSETHLEQVNDRVDRLDRRLDDKDR